MVQRPALALRPGRRFLRFPVHAGQRPMSCERRLRRVAYIEDRQNEIGEAVQMRGSVRIAATRPPQSMQSNSLDRAKADFPRIRRVSANLVDTQARDERLLAAVEAVVDGVRKIILLALITVQ